MEDFALEEGAVRINEEFPLDVYTLMRSHTYADFVLEARRIEQDGVSISYLSPAALIQLKSPSMREKDQLDVAMLRKLMTSGTEGEPVPRGRNPDA